jgi:xanthine dehydrogenase YagR molybdenum-binding subunit
MKLRFRHLLHRCEAVHTGIVDEDAGRSESAFALAKSRFTSADVRLDRHGLAAIAQNVADHATSCSRQWARHPRRRGRDNPLEEVDGPKAIFSFTAVFAEVLSTYLGLVRLNRCVGAYDAGNIINPKTARSQAIGGIIWGVGQALLEQSETDPHMGAFCI